MATSTSDYALDGGSGKGDNASGYACTSGVAKSAAQAAVSAVGTTASRVRTMAQEGPLSFRVLAFLSGILMVVASVFDFLRGLLRINVTHVVVSVFVCGFAFLMIVLEGRGFVPELILDRFQTRIYENAKFLRFISGRGVLYFFAGVLQFSHWSFLNMVSGGVAMFIGFLFVTVGRSTAPKLSDLRAAVGTTEAELAGRFSDYDRDGDGFLSQADFDAMVEGLNLSQGFSSNELVAAFCTVDTDDDGRISFEEFKMWWEGSEPSLINQSIV